MLADILPILIPIMGFIIIAGLAIRALQRREGYCQQGMKYCFWCKRKCDFFALQERDLGRGA